ncbi:MAG: hypothetical protein JJT96_05140 [Opitutales bacterium]|nr:hypothetical protein [Opitutales bacterium]
MNWSRILTFPAAFLLIAVTVFAHREGDVLDGTGLDLRGPDGTLLNLRIVDQQFRLYAMDETREVIALPPMFHRVILATEEIPRSSRTMRILLLPSGEGDFATSPRRIPVPFNYWVTLFVGEPNEDGERDLIPRTRFSQPIADEGGDDEDGEG